VEAGIASGDSGLRILLSLMYAVTIHFLCLNAPCCGNWRRRQKKRPHLLVYCSEETKTVERHGC